MNLCLMDLCLMNLCLMDLCLMDPPPSLTHIHPPLPPPSPLPPPLQNLGVDWEERVLPSIGNEVVKAVVAQYNAEQLLTQRDKVSKEVRSGLGLGPG
jgi:hypothetical protein